MSAWIASPVVPDEGGYYVALLSTSKRPRLLYFSRQRGWTESYCNTPPHVTWWCALPPMPKEK